MFKPQHRYKIQHRPGSRSGRHGKTKLADIWAMTGEYKIQLPLNDQGQPIRKMGLCLFGGRARFARMAYYASFRLLGWPSIPQKFKNDCWTEIEVV